MARILNPEYQRKEDFSMIPTLEKENAESFEARMKEQGIEPPVENQRKKAGEKGVPIQFKVLLTIEEAALFTGIGQNKLREISNEDDCPFVLWNGSKRMFKREKLVAYLYSMFSI
jgi:hypothetical protein